MTEQMVALIATAIGSPVLVKIVEALIKWSSGRVSREKRLEQKIDQLEEDNTQLRRDIQQVEDRAHKCRREAEEKVHQYRLKMLRHGLDPNN
ncbi:hypothetical protein QDX21_07015 [Auritidibacter ignavus]|uniref:Uncharacterized protein n=1 Tax=Auritidibacter ignavus TaxID=678932 RepID=A0AAJ6DB08_9MICC|nr:hypothetical protein [Auritidibacter ignavus]WGH91458.1 hypothetical protein QDX23_03565 [Auritidibacter ignavus]WGH92085.1 hypothetical protein QDX21_07015 [Auritidibacter ignavus]